MENKKANIFLKINFNLFITKKLRKFFFNLNNRKQIFFLKIKMEPRQSFCILIPINFIYLTQKTKLLSVSSFLSY